MRKALLGALALLATSLLIAPAFAASASSTADVQKVSADIRPVQTPDQHHALADRYRSTAEEMKKSAAESQAMSEMMNGPSQADLKPHFDEIAKIQEQMAAEYDALAKAQMSAAGQ
jgi:hypothetical protein